MNFSQFLSMDRKDLLSAVGTLVFSAVISTLYTVVTTPNFNVADFDWKMVLNMILVAVLTSVTKSSSTTSEGKLMGMKVK